MEAFKDRLKKARKQAGLTQLQLADAIGTTQQNIWKYEHEISKPGFETITKLAVALRVPLDYLVPVRVFEDSTEFEKERQRLIQAAYENNNLEEIAVDYHADGSASVYTTEDQKAAINKKINNLNLNGLKVAEKQIDLVLKVPEYTAKKE